MEGTSKHDIFLLQNFQKYFEAENMYIVNADLATDFCDNLLVINQDRVVSTYILKRRIAKEMQNGIDLFSRKDFVGSYYSDHKELVSNIDRFMKKLTSTPLLAKDDFSSVIKMFRRYVRHYSITEFYYTDKAYTLMKKNQAIQENLQRLEKVKFEAREYLNKIFLGEDCFIYWLMMQLVSQFKINKDEILLYTAGELHRIFEGELTGSNLLRERAKHFVIYREGDRKTTFEGGSARKFIDKFYTEESSRELQLTGIVANPGKTKGRARVLPQDYMVIGKPDQVSRIADEMELGEILVADTTSPELVSLCKKASAIITNQGGQLSHAAIISRELKIPCIVGTGNATRLLKTGDVVEIDADHGIVTILQRAKEAK